MLRTRQILILGAAMAFTTSAFAKDCSDVEFSADLRDRFPQIDEACLDVMDHEGNQYVKLSAKVVSANSRTIALRYQRQDGSYIKEVFRSKALPSDFRINIQGRKVRPSSLKRGQELNTYVMLGGEIATLMSDEPLAVAVASSTGADIDFDEAPAAMPTTASIIPMLGLFGVFSLAMGGLVRIYRKRVA
jgi:hypothetical protein